MSCANLQMDIEMDDCMYDEDFVSFLRVHIQVNVTVHI